MTDQWDAQKEALAVCAVCTHVDPQANPPLSACWPCIASAISSAVEDALWTCPDCAFRFHRDHTDSVTGGYTCPVCLEAQAVKAAVEDCCRAICEWCEAGDKLACDGDPSKWESWYHVEDDGEDVDCDAAVIRARGSKA